MAHLSWKVIMQALQCLKCYSKDKNLWRCIICPLFIVIMAY